MSSLIPRQFEQKPIYSNLKLQGEDLRTISLAAMAAGLTTFFDAPLDAAMFALEKHIVEYYEALMPAIE